MQSLGGVLWARRDGKLLRIGEGTFTYSLGGFKRETKLSSNGVAGFIRKPVPPSCEIDIIVDRDLDVENDIILPDSQTLALELDNKSTFILHEAYYVGEGEISTDGTMKAKFEGKKGELVHGR